MTIEQVRATHHYGFRAGEWAKIITMLEHDGRECFLVEFPDGVTDWWPVIDPADPYEFRSVEESPPPQ